MELAITEADVVEVVLPAAHTAEEKEENRVLVSALDNNDGDVAAEEMETETEAALPTPASSEVIGEVTETMTEAEDRSGPALATAETEENSAQVQEVPALASDVDVGGIGSEKEMEPEVQEVQEVMARPTMDTAEDTEAEDTVAVAESRHKCQCPLSNYDMLPLQPGT